MRLSKGIALTLFAVITVISIIMMFCFIDYGYTGFLLFGIMMAVNFAWMIVWAKKHDEQARYNKQKNTFDRITEEVNVWVEQWRKNILANISNDTEAQEIDNAVKWGYGYVIAKAARVLISAREKQDYAQDDFFHYPLPGWNLNAIYAGCNQLVNGNGLTKYNGLVQSHTNARELFELFHFSFVDVEKTDREGVYKMNFIHKVERIKSFVYYCPLSDLSTLNTPFYSKVWINDRLKLKGIIIEEPVFVSVIENKGIIKICIEDATANRFAEEYAIAAESAYLFQKYPESQIKPKGKAQIENKPVTEYAPCSADILVCEFPDGSKKEFIFDISDIRNPFDII
ncbi:MAG: hypothetical protein LBH19_07950 [Dysgonamonadaceae bacterium]|jgi:hypothetical protein|nr:hypothetical protein [Dysgonamonadaceae bacterium]